MQDQLSASIQRARRWPDVREPARRLAIRLFDRPLVGRYTLLDLPIIHKLVIANSVLVGLAVVGGMWFAHSSLWAALRDIHAGLTAVGVMVAVALSAGANYLIVRTVLAPLESLRRTVEAVRRGDVGARAGDTILSDPGVELFRLAINDMLDEMARDRERLHALSAGLLTAQEEERKRVARELHDEVGQLAAGLLATLQRAKLVMGMSRAGPIIDEAIELSVLACEQVRRVAYEMRPAILDDLGLVPALESFIRECCGRRPGLHAELRSQGLSERLPLPVEVTLYRVVREALSNAGRHADPTRVRLLLEQRGRVVEALIEDDGRGFDLDRVLHTPGAAVGLMGMQERVAMMGGSLIVDSAPGNGTRVRVQLPLD